MYIKYLKNIYRVGKFYSVTKTGQTGIYLTKQDGNYNALEFASSTIRDYILEQIWEQLKSESKTYDIDEAIKIFTCGQHYNLT